MHHPRVKRLAGLGISAMILAAVPLAGFNLLGVASAEDGTPAAAGNPTTALAVNGHELTSDEIQCMSDHGFAPPQPVAGETGPRVETHIKDGSGDDADLAALKDAATACGLPVPDPDAEGPGGRFGVVNGTPLTDEQMQCLSDHGAPTPELEEGSADVPFSKEAGPKEAEAFRAAAEACGLPTPPDAVIGGPGMSIGSATAKEA